MDIGCTAYPRRGQNRYFGIDLGVMLPFIMLIHSARKLENSYFGGTKAFFILDRGT